MSDPAIMKTIGGRIKDYRIAMELKQADLAFQSGVSLSTLGKIESGLPVSTALLLSVLRALGLLENLDLLVPESKVSPSQMLKFQGHKVKRVR